MPDIKKLYIKIPILALTGSLSNAEIAVFLQLLLRHFRVRGNDYKKDFYVSDRILASLAGVSTETVWKAKKKLLKMELITYRISGRKTHYKILLEQKDKMGVLNL